MMMSDLPRAVCCGDSGGGGPPRRAGLEVADLRCERLRTVFYDVGAVVSLLRLVIWIVPDCLRSGIPPAPLLAPHEHVGRHGYVVARATRFLINARKRG